MAAVNTHHSLVNGQEKLIAVVGLDHAIVVDTDDALLICSDHSMGEIRSVLKKLREMGSVNYL